MNAATESNDGDNRPYRDPPSIARRKKVTWLTWLGLELGLGLRFVLGLGLGLGFMLGFG